MGLAIAETICHSWLSGYGLNKTEFSRKVVRTYFFLNRNKKHNILIGWYKSSLIHYSHGLLPQWTAQHWGVMKSIREFFCFTISTRILSCSFLDVSLFYLTSNSKKCPFKTLVRNLNSTDVCDTAGRPGWLHLLTSEEPDNICIIFNREDWKLKYNNFRNVTYYKLFQSSATFENNLG